MGTHVRRTATAVVLAGTALLSTTAVLAAPPAAATPARTPASTQASAATAAERRVLPRAADLYAIDAASSRVVRFDHLHRGWVSSAVGHGWADPQQVQVSAQGVAWVIDGGTLVRVARGEQRVVKTFPNSSTGLALDPAGNAYLVDDGQLVRVAASGRRTTVLAEVTGVAGLGVDRRGRVTTASIATSGYLDLSTYPVGGGTPTVRHTDVQTSGYVADLKESAAGAVVVRVPTSGASGYVGLYRVDPGSSTGSRPTTKLSDSAAAFDEHGRLVVVEGKVWCPNPAVITGQCTPDRSVEQLLVYPRDDASRYDTIPVRELSVPAGGLAVGARDAAYAAEDTPDASIKVVGRHGGAATVLAPGTYRALEVPAGR